MNRIVTFGLSGFFALIGFCLIDGPKPAKAFNGWQFCGCCGCQGWHPWHINRCYSGSGCWTCYGAGASCCASNCTGCWSQQRCYGCYGSYGCHGPVYYSCHGPYGGCSGCGGCYGAAIPTIIVPAAPAPAVGAPETPRNAKTTRWIFPENNADLSDLGGETAIIASDYVRNDDLTNGYITEPR